MRKRWRNLKIASARSLAADDLPTLAIAFETDKWGGHFYAKHYQHHFQPLREKKLVVLEIGVGGYDDPRAGGGSLRMWKTYFPHAKIYGIDIFDKTPHDEERIKTFRGSQTDAQFLERVLDEIGTPDIIIDDGSHYNHHVTETFGLLFPRLADDGIYAVEDTQTSYWKSTKDCEWNGSTDLNAPHTMMNLFKRLADGLNHAEFVHEHQPNYFDKHVVSLHFYHNLVFVYKGRNDEPSTAAGTQVTEADFID